MYPLLLKGNKLLAEGSFFLPPSVGVEFLELLSEHARDQVDPRKGFRLVDSHLPSVPEDGDPVCDLENLVEKMSDEDDADALLLQTAHDTE
jgi:hypothetical protein